MHNDRPAVYLKLRCLEPGCGYEPASCSVGLDMDDGERELAAESYISYAASYHRRKHAAGVEATFSDDPARRLVFSAAGKNWGPRDLFSGAARA